MADVLKFLEEKVINSIKESKDKYLGDDLKNHSDNTIDYIKKVSKMQEADSSDEIEKKIYKWLDGVWIQTKTLALLIYLPICLFIFCRDGYNVGGTDLFNYPYREPNSNLKHSVNKINEIYNQQGGFGKYDKVGLPWNLLSRTPTGVVDNLLYWFLDSGATSFAWGRMIATVCIEMFRPFCGYTGGGESYETYNHIKFFTAIPVGIFVLAPALLVGLFISTLFNTIIPIIKVKDHIWPFVGTRIFSPIVWYLILLVLNLFTPYSSFLMILISLCIISWTSIQSIALYFFVFAAPFLFVYKSVKNKNTDQLKSVLRSVINGVFWVLLILVTLFPTKEYFGPKAMTGSIIALIFLAFRTKFNVFN